MSSIGAISGVPTQALSQLGGPGMQPRVGGLGLSDGMRTLQGAAGAGDGFGKMLDGLVSTVSAKDAAANELTRKVLMGDTDQLHQSVIAMQEASVSFSLMVEVRNKLVESYQELMRMQV